MRNPGNSPWMWILNAPPPAASRRRSQGGIWQLHSAEFTSFFSPSLALLRHNLHAINFWVYNSMLFSLFTELCYCLHNLILQQFNYPKTEGCREKGTLLHCWWECKSVKLLWRTVWRVSKKLKIELPYDSAISFLGTYPEKRWKL